MRGGRLKAGRLDCRFRGNRETRWEEGVGFGIYSEVCGREYARYRMVLVRSFSDINSKELEEYNLFKAFTETRLNNQIYDLCS